MVAVSNSSAALCALPRWTTGAATPGARSSASSSSCSSSTRVEAALCSSAKSDSGPQSLAEATISLTARTAAPRSASDPLEQKLFTKGNPMPAPSVAQPSSFRSRRCMRAARSANARTMTPMPSKTGKLCNVSRITLWSCDIDGSSAHFGRGVFFSSWAHSADTAFAIDIRSDRDALLAKTEASSAQMGPLCRSTPTDVVGQRSDQRGSHPFRTS
mmetsp:Transcript_67517/g.162042  ORF Transcript_67517/g.162042 Transcript_67517/m.162042 type:complete len:215 (-) Transcript_67517:4746-5390(-)